MSENSKINPFPSKWIGLWRVKNRPYYFKDTWPTAPFGDRWRRIKARMTASPVPAEAAL